MWIEATPNGKYKACERYTDPLTGKTKKATTTIEKDTKAQRKAAENVLKAKIENATTDTIKSTTLEELTARYLQWQKTTLKPSSYRSAESHMEYIKDILGADVFVPKLTAKYVSEKLVDKSSTPYMTNRNILYFKALINWAYNHDYISDKQWLDKIQRVKAPKPISQVEDHYLEADELKLLIKSIPQKHWKLLTQFLALSGLRIGEVMALTDADVDTEIRVTKTYHSTTGLYSDTPKTDSSVRSVFVQPELQSVIKKIRIYKKEVVFRTGRQSDIFFPMTDGSILSYDAYQKRLKRCAMETLGRNVTPHMLRHTHTSLLAEQGIPLEIISRRLGHHDSAITREVYYHVTKKMRKKENQLLSAIKIL